MKKEDFTKLLESDSGALLLDIREAEELTVNKTLPGVTHMPMGKVFTEAVKDNLPTDKKIVVFCRTGARASVVVRELSERGYDIEALEGGLNALAE